MQVFKSRKFWVAICSILTIIFSPYLGIEEGRTQELLVAVVGAYMLSQGIADHGKEAEKAKQGK